MSQRHTVGKLKVVCGLLAIDDGTEYGSSQIALMDRNEPRTRPTERDANAQRLADCWNACIDMENPAKEIALFRESENDKTELRRLLIELAREIRADGIESVHALLKQADELLEDTQ